MGPVIWTNRTDFRVHLAKKLITHEFITKLLSLRRKKKSSVKTPDWFLYQHNQKNLSGLKLMENRDCDKELFICEAITLQNVRRLHRRFLKVIVIDDNEHSDSRPVFKLKGPNIAEAC